VGDAIKAVAAGSGVNLIVLSWLVAAVIRIAQGSATVAMLTTAAMIYPMMDPTAGATLPFHPMYIFLSIGFGAFCCSWMNDSGFWVVNRLSGMTETETLRSWTVILTAVSIAGLALTFVAAKLVPGV
jgi:GntP family gluconate:H+ symporter